MGFLGNPALVLLTQHDMPVANYVGTEDPTATTNPVRVPFTWVNMLTGRLWLCVDNTEDANIWKLIYGHRGALVYRNAATGVQTITSGSYQALQLDAEIYDTDGFHDNSTNNTRLTIPAGVSKVRLKGCMQPNAMTSGICYIKTQKNGADYTGQGFVRVISDGFGSPVVLSTAVIDVVEGDYFEFLIYQNSGSDKEITATSINNWFSIEVVE